MLAELEWSCSQIRRALRDKEERDAAKPAWQRSDFIAITLKPPTKWRPGSNSIAVEYFGRRSVHYQSHTGGEVDVLVTVHKLKAFLVRKEQRGER